MISNICALGLTNDELSRWFDDDLPATRMELIRAHSATCLACRERLAAFDEIGAGLRSLTPPPLDLARLMASLDEAPAPASPGMPLHTRHARRHSRRWVTGAAGLAAVLILSLLAGYIFVNHGRPLPGNTSPATPVPLLLTDELPLQSTLIAMSSPSDGWAFGSKSANGDAPVIALHYANGKWTRVKTDVQGQINALKMLSATDGWLIGSNVYHYDGHFWREVTVPRESAYDQFGQISAFSPSAIWISGDNANPLMLHYDGTAWIRQDLPMLEPFHLGYYVISGISMASADEGWAVGETHKGVTPFGVLLHYTNGVWKVASVYPNYEPLTISMASATDGWIGGDYQTDFKQNADGSGSAILRPFLWRFNNGSWRDAPIPGGYKPPLAGQVSYIQMLSPTSGWMIAGISSGAQVGSDTNPLFHLQHGQWVQFPGYTVPGPPGYYATAFVSSDEFWGFGQLGLSHYYKGEWKRVAP